MEGRIGVRLQLAQPATNTIAAHARIYWLAAIFRGLKRNCSGLPAVIPDLIRDPCWMSYLCPTYARFSPASAVWIADQVRNDKLLFRVLSSYRKIPKQTETSSLSSQRRKQNHIANAGVVG